MRKLFPTEIRMSHALPMRLALAAAFLLATAAPAWAQPPITGTEVSRFEESFSEEFLCQDEPYTVSVNGRAVVHFTFFEETGALHFHEVVHAHVVAVPLDGTGPSYTGTFRVSDSENIRAVKHGDVLVETDTDLNRIALHGSDGSRAFLKEHAHFTANANGEMSVDLRTTKMVCT
jgi:hypothetical protein